MRMTLAESRIVITAAICFLGCLITLGPARAQSKLLLINTAQTIGANVYNLALQYRGNIFAVGPRTWLVKAKIGIGKRIEVGNDYDLSHNRASLWQWNGKYVMPVDQRTAIGIGFQNLGRHDNWEPYAVVSRYVSLKTRITLGVSDSASGDIFLAGLDGSMSKRWHWMTDYNTGPDGYASGGFLCILNKRWTTKFGAILQRDGRNNIHLEFIYNERY